MPEAEINYEFIDCLFINHEWFDDVLQRELNDEQYEGVIQRLEEAGLDDVKDMVVSEPHHPCIRVNNGILPSNYSYVADTLYKLQQDRGLSAQRLLQVLNYFNAIGKDHILDLQVAY